MNWYYLKPLEVLEEYFNMLKQVFDRMKFSMFSEGSLSVYFNILK